MSTHPSSYRWILLIFLVYLSAQIITGEAPSSLKFTSVLFRHGDRSPIKGFPGDLYNESAWPQGYGQLSEEGMKQEFSLGQYLRQRYTGLLDEEYRRTQIYVESTTLDRTIMSAQSVLAGLYPPIKDHWNQEKKWQPIPVHIIDANNEKMLRYDGSRCPTLEKASEELKNSSVIKQLAAKHKLLLEKISNATGGQISDIWQIWSMYDTLLCESLHGLAWPSWVSQTMMDTISLEIVPVVQEVDFCHPVARRLTGGLLLDHIVTNMRLKARRLMEQQDLRAFFYSAHDTTVLALMCALGVYNHRMVPYTTSVYVELHHQNTQQEVQDDPKLTGWYVQVWLRNETNTAPYPLTIPGCSFNCSLYNFDNLTKSNRPKVSSSECGFFTLPGITQLWHIVLGTMGAGLGLLILIFIVSSCCQGKCVRRRLRPRPSTYGKLRASEVVTRPEEMPMIGTTGGDSDIEG